MEDWPCGTTDLPCVDGDLIGVVVFFGVIALLVLGAAVLQVAWERWHSRQLRRRFPEYYGRRASPPR